MSPTIPIYMDFEENEGIKQKNEGKCLEMTRNNATFALGNI